MLNLNNLEFDKVREIPEFILLKAFCSKISPWNFGRCQHLIRRRFLHWAGNKRYVVDTIQCSDSCIWLNTFILETITSQNVWCGPSGSGH